jgi:hypothetical protein
MIAEQSLRRLRFGEGEQVVARTMEAAAATLSRLPQRLRAADVGVWGSNPHGAMAQQGKTRHTGEENMNELEFKVILDSHVKWLSGEDEGQCAKLIGADLRGVDLIDANLIGAKLIGAKLIDADLGGAKLMDAKLIDADLRGAKLMDAKLDGANLIGAKLEGATLNWQSHDLIAEILRRAAGDDAEKRKIAGLILVSRDWCWEEFLSLNDPMTEWALKELSVWAEGDTNTPEIFRTKSSTP